MNRAVVTLSLFFAFTFFQATAQEGGGAPAPGPEAALRVAHLAPDAPEVTVLVDGELTFGGVAPGLVTGYALVGEGEHQITILPASEDATGTTPVTGGGAPAALVVATVTTEAGFYYTVAVTEAAAGEGNAGTGETGAFVRGVVAGEAQPAGAGGALELVTFTDTLGDFPPAGEALVRMVHVSPDAPAVTLVVAPEGSAPSAASGDPAALEPLAGSAFVTGLPFAFASAYAPLAAGIYDLQAQTANGVALLDLSDTLIEAGTVYTLYLSGRSASTLAMNASVDALVSQAIE